MRNGFVENVLSGFGLSTVTTKTNALSSTVARAANNRLSEHYLCIYLDAGCVDMGFFQGNQSLLVRILA